MRPFTNGMTPPFTMIGEAVFKVLESKDENFPVGATILSKAGWILTGIIKVKVYLFRFVWSLAGIMEGNAMESIHYTTKICASNWKSLKFFNSLIYVNYTTSTMSAT